MNVVINKACDVAPHSSPAVDIPIVEHRRNLEEALRLMKEKRLPAVGVSDGAGRLIGLVTPENIGEMMMIQAARPERGAGAAWRSEPPRSAV
jgi:CBS domain containing-hemolysin-like protein